LAEPYALWAIENQPRLQLPGRHEAIVLTDNLAHVARLKRFLLNGGYSFPAERWRRDRRAPGETVLQARLSEALVSAEKAQRPQGLAALTHGEAASQNLPHHRHTHRAGGNDPDTVASLNPWRQLHAHLSADRAARTAGSRPVRRRPGARAGADHPARRGPVQRRARV
jgi:hypothetical protein